MARGHDYNAQTLILTVQVTLLSLISQYNEHNAPSACKLEGASDRRCPVHYVPYKCSSMRLHASKRQGKPMPQRIQTSPASSDLLPVPVQENWEGISTNRTGGKHLANPNKTNTVN